MRWSLIDVKPLKMIGALVRLMKIDALVCLNEDKHSMFDED